MKYRLIDKIYNKFEKEIEAGRFGRINKIFTNIDCFSVDIDYLIGLLVITVPIKSKIKTRPRFFNKVDIQCAIRKEDPDNLLQGLQ